MDDIVHSTDTLIGKEIDGYRIESVIGRGGMGIVYKAEDTALGRKVAIKMIARGLAHDEAFLRRFRSEARALARIDSPNIVRVHALRQTDAGLFIVMEYVDGGTLSDVLEDGAMPWSQAFPIVRQMLTAFDHAHGLGVIHRDIKPSNIMLTASGTVKVTDFGLAKVRQGDAMATATRGVAGTLYYMSPEQVKGLGNVDHRTDIYALAMTIYQMLAGRLPFDKGSGEYTIMRNIVEEPLSPPDTYRSDLPEGLASIIMKGLAKQRDDRYESAGAMLQAFASFDASHVRPASLAPSGTGQRHVGEPVSADARKKPSTDGKPVARRAVVGVAAVVVAALLVWGGIYVASRPAASPSQPPTMAEVSVVTEPPGARIWVNDVEQLQGTPLRGKRVEPGDVHVRVTKEGYAPLDTTIAAAAGDVSDVSLRLLAEAGPAIASTDVPATDDGGQEADDGASGNEEATPPGEETTPPGRDDEAGTHDDANGSTADATPGDTVSDTDGPPTVVTVAVSLRIADGVGQIRVGDDTRQGSGTFQLKPGAHRVTLVRDGQAVSTTIDVAPGQQPLTFYLTRQVSLQTRSPAGEAGPFASIWINGEQLTDAGGQPIYTPRVIPLPLGDYKIELRRTGYDIDPPAWTGTIEPMRTKPERLNMIATVRAQ